MAKVKVRSATAPAGPRTQWSTPLGTTPPVNPRAIDPSLPWRSARTEPAACRIERQIKSAILSGQFKVGDYLGSENDLAAKLGVSRLPVREAVGRLQALGLVEVRTGAAGGVRVAVGKLDHIAELLKIGRASCRERVCMLV